MRTYRTSTERDPFTYSHVPQQNRTRALICNNYCYILIDMTQSTCKEQSLGQISATVLARIYFEPHTVITVPKTKDNSSRTIIFCESRISCTYSGSDSS